MVRFFALFALASTIAIVMGANTEKQAAMCESTCDTKGRNASKCPKLGENNAIECACKSKEYSSAFLKCIATTCPAESKTILATGCAICKTVDSTYKCGSNDGKGATHSKPKNGPKAKGEDKDKPKSKHKKPSSKGKTSDKAKPKADCVMKCVGDNIKYTKCSAMDKDCLCSKGKDHTEFEKKVTKCISDKQCNRGDIMRYQGMCKVSIASLIKEACNERGTKRSHSPALKKQTKNQPSRPTHPKNPAGLPGYPGWALTCALDNLKYTTCGRIDNTECLCRDDNYQMRFEKCARATCHEDDWIAFARTLSRTCNRINGVSMKHHYPKGHGKEKHTAKGHKKSTGKPKSTDMKSGSKHSASHKDESQQHDSHKPKNPESPKHKSGDKHHQHDGTPTHPKDKSMPTPKHDSKPKSPPTKPKMAPPAHPTPSPKNKNNGGKTGGGDVDMNPPMAKPNGTETMPPTTNTTTSSNQTTSGNHTSGGPFYIAAFPACAGPCWGVALSRSKSTCGQSDASCLCQDTAFQAAFSNCSSAACSASDNNVAMTQGVSQCRTILSGGTPGPNTTSGGLAPNGTSSGQMPGSPTSGAAILAGPSAVVSLGLASLAVALSAILL